MKNILLLVIGTIMFISCTNEDNLYLSVPVDEIAFSVDGGEQSIQINSAASVNYSCLEEWILVRPQANNVLRIIVEPNYNEESREGFIVLSNGNSKNTENSTIHIVQDGIRFNLDNDKYNFDYKSCSIPLQIPANVKVEIVNDCDWIESLSSDDILILNVSKNYTMNIRCGIVHVKVGNVEKHISITQGACPWYDSFDMQYVEGGTFIMGAQNQNNKIANYDKSSYEIESPIHNVTVDNFYISKFEVTQEQWESAMGYNPSKNIGNRLPVETVTWEEVQEFISTLNANTGLCYRLPTEAEWEYAAKGGIQSSGYRFSGTESIISCAWFYSNSNGHTHEVGLKVPNELGIYDMSGNVREWCEDWFDYYSPNDTYNPQGPVSGSGKVNRGGSWTTPDINCRNSYRQTNYTFESAPDLGFRLVLVK